MKIAERLFAAISGLSLVVVFVVAFVQVVQRYLFSMSIPWATDVIRICFIYSVFSGMCVGILRQSHLNIDVLVQVVPNVVKKLFGVASNVIVIVFLSVMFRYSIPFIQSNADQYTPYIEFPMSWVYMVFPVTAVVMIVSLLADTWSKLAAWNKPKEGGAK